MTSLSEKEKQMDAIYREILNLKKSPLYKYRKENGYFPVVGNGSLKAKIMFVGEAPGKTEAVTGKPFCGRSGKMLDEMLNSVGLKRQDVYITNVVKDRPEENRDPTVDEINFYSKFLDRQIEIIKPKVLVGLGRFSGKYLMEKFGLGEDVKAISDIHGKEFSAKSGFGKITLVTLYHPAVALYNGSKKSELMKDFAVLKKYV
jgi:uracil-DNA glycosylase